MSKMIAIAFWVIVSPAIIYAIIYAIGETLEHFIP